MKRFILLCLLELASDCFAQRIEFDRSFGDSGVVSGKGVCFIQKIISLPGGKILCLGAYKNNSVAQPSIFKFNSDGMLDSTFSDDGILKDTNKIYMNPPYPFTSQCFMNIQPDGRIFMAGLTPGNTFYNTYISCNDSNGNPIITFGKSGVLILNAIENVSRGFLVGFSTTPNNEIIACWEGYNTKGGSSYGFTLAKFDSTGCIDRSFGTDGFQFFNNTIMHFRVEGVTILKDGSILCLGSDHSEFSSGHTNEKTAIIKLHSDGTYCDDFGIEGKMIFDVDTNFIPQIDIGLDVLEKARNVIEMEDHRLIVSTITDKKNSGDYILRLMPDGSLDKTFGNNGVSNGLKHIYDIAVLKDGDIIACHDGGFTHFFPNGMVDSSMYQDCPFTINCVTMQDDQSILFGGYPDTLDTSPFLARLNIDSSVMVPEVNAPTSEVSIFPVPFRDVITFRSDQSVIRKITLFNLNGRCVYSTLTDYKSCTIRINLSKGIYVCKVETSKGVEYHKIAKGD